MAAKKNIECHGGLTGINDSQIMDSYAVSSVRGGAVCGINKGKIFRCYGSCSNNSVSVVGEGKEIDSWVVRKVSELQEKNVATWDFKRIWSFNKKGFPIFKNDNWYVDSNLKKPYLMIDTAEKLLDFAHQIWTGNREMAKTNVLIAADLNLKHKKIKPIGTMDNPYTGIFDGAGHVISNVKIVEDENKAAGLFGVVSRAKICNVTVKGNVFGGSNTGLLCGVNELSEILCCSTIGEVHGFDCAGGLCGKNQGTISRCNFYGYIRRKKRSGSFKWFLPVAVVFLVEVGTVTALAMTSPDVEWRGIYKPVAEEKSIIPIRNEETAQVTTEDNTISIRVGNRAFYNGGDTVLLSMSNPSSSNQYAVMEIRVAKEYLTGEITYEEAGIYNAQYEYLVVAGTGAIPPGYRVEHFEWKGFSDEESFSTGDYPAFVKVMFYDAETNEKALLDSLFEISLKIN